MIRQSIIYLILTILVVLFAQYAHLLIVYIDMFYTYLNVKLAPFFSHLGTYSFFLRKVLLLTLIPVLIAAIPALIYRLVYRRKMPHFIGLTWCLWLIIVLSNVLVR